MFKLLLKTFLLAVVVSPVIALVSVLLDLSDTHRQLLTGMAALYIFLAYYFPRAEEIDRAERRRLEDEYMDRFEEERRQARKKD